MNYAKTWGLGATAMIDWLRSEFPDLAAGYDGGESVVEAMERHRDAVVALLAEGEREERR